MTDYNSEQEISKMDLENKKNFVMDFNDFKEQVGKYFEFIDKNIENFKNFGEDIISILSNSDFLSSEKCYQEYLDSPRDFFVHFFPSDISDWGILHINNFKNLDFSFLDGYSPKIKNLMVNICLKTEDVSGLDERMNELFDQITSINDVIDIIKIISENNLYISNPTEFFENEITDLKLNQIMLDKTIQKSKNNNVLKMEKLFNSVYSKEVFGDISVTFKFIDQENNLKLHSFILIEDYFINCLENFDKSKNICLEIGQNFSEKIYFEIVKYLYTSTISLDLPHQMLIDLYFFGEKYVLKLKDIALKILQLGDELRIKIERPFKLIPNDIYPLNYPSFFVEFISDYLILVEIKNQLYYVQKNFGLTINEIKINKYFYNIFDGESTKNFLKENNILYLKDTDYEVKNL